MTLCKICGIRTVADLQASSNADWVGLVFYPSSPRHLTLAEARLISDAAASAPKPRRVALIVDAEDEDIAEIIEAARPSMLQCHGSESPARIMGIQSHFDIEVMKAIRVNSAASLKKAAEYDGVADYLLFDSPPHRAALPPYLPGGTGHSFDWDLLSSWQGRSPWMLAGGLTPSNVGTAIALSGAKAVDVSSGVESTRGIKDHKSIHRFLSAAASAKID